MTTQLTPPENAIAHGDCIAVLSELAASSVDFVLTDPPYLVRYESRDGRRVRNDDNSDWLWPAFQQIYRALKPSSYCVSFYGWNRADEFIGAWRGAGFRIVGHLVFHKKYASNSRLLRYSHECAYLLAKGQVTPPARPIADVIEWKYTGNRLGSRERRPALCLRYSLVSIVKHSVDHRNRCGTLLSVVTGSRASRDSAPQYFSRRAPARSVGHPKQAGLRDRRIQLRSRT
jgi:adenine-specific DNA-methyltransferase